MRCLLLAFRREPPVRTDPDEDSESLRVLAAEYDGEAGGSADGEPEGIGEGLRRAIELCRLGRRALDERKAGGDEAVLDGGRLDGRAQQLDSAARRLSVRRPCFTGPRPGVEA